MGTRHLHKRIDEVSTDFEEDIRNVRERFDSQIAELTERVGKLEGDWRTNPSSLVTTRGLFFDGKSYKTWEEAEERIRGLVETEKTLRAEVKQLRDKERRTAVAIEGLHRWKARAEAAERRIEIIDKEAEGLRESNRRRLEKVVSLRRQLERAEALYENARLAVPWRSRSRFPPLGPKPTPPPVPPVESGR